MDISYSVIGDLSILLAFLVHIALYVTHVRSGSCDGQ